MTTKQKMICNEILKHYGVSPQLRKLAEECGEAVQAALKYDYRANEITKQALITEIADLEIMVQQIKFVVGYEKVNKEIDFKLNRQLERIKNARKIEEEQLIDYRFKRQKTHNKFRLCDGHIHRLK